MTDVVLFHHAQGLTDGVQALAARLTEAGHTVHTPDTFEGHTFDDLDAGLAYAKGVGFGAVMERGVTAVQELPSDVVYVGISMGAMAAQQLAQTREGARGAVLLASAVPPEEFGGWPATVPLQVHSHDADPIFVGEGDIEAAHELVEAAQDAELFLYPGDQHLFMDNSLPGYDAAATDQLTERVLAFLARV